MEVLYTAYSSISVETSEVFEALSSVDIESTYLFEALESIDIAKDGFATSFSSIGVDAYFLDEVLRSVDIVDGDSFIILIDALQQELSGTALGSFGQVDIDAQLLVNDAEVAIRDFQFQVPTSRLGSLLNVTLATPSIIPIPNGASVKFQLIVTTGGTSYPIVLMDNGKLQERDSTVRYRGGKSDGPIDEVTFGALDVIADKFGLAPRRPVVMFDPSRITYDEVNVRGQDCVHDELGQPILPIIEPVFGLTMRQIISRAYTGGGGAVFMSRLGPAYSHVHWIGLLGGGINDQNGCGFTGVITNIADYRVRRADFTIEGGWHDGAQPAVGQYNPFYFVEGTQLFIIDVDQILPYGALAHVITLGDHKSLSEQLTFKPDANAVLLTYQYANGDPAEDAGRLVREVFTETVDPDPDAGVTDAVLPGDPGYTKTTIRRWDYEYYFADEPTNVLATYPKSIDIETQQTITWSIKDPDTGDVTEESYGVRVTHQETTDYTYENELLVNSRKIIKGLVTAGPSSGFDLVDIEREDIHISWTDDPYHPGIKLQDRVSTDIYGAIVYSDTPETIDGPLGSIEDVVRKIPILLGQSSSIMTVDSVVNLELTPIKAIRSTLHQLNDNQFNVCNVETDLLNNTVKRSYSQPVTGTNSTSQYGSKSRTIMLRDLVSEAEIGPRIPVPVNAYELPRLRALELGHKVLQRFTNPLMRMPIDLPGVDFTIARGSIVTAQKRDASYTPNYLVTGYSITGVSLGKTGHRISQSLEAVELLTV